MSDSVRSVADLTTGDLERADAFLTLFHARLDLDTGLLTYVDAGHGLMLVVSRDGVVKLPGTNSLPLGVLPDQRYAESRARLRPGDSLVAFSDGVLDIHPELDARDREMEAAAAALLKGAESIEEMAERLTTNPDLQAGDDVAVVVLRRLPA